jgi:hypothetical protein
MPPPALPFIDYARHPAYGGEFEPDEELRRRALAELQPAIDEQLQRDDFKRDMFGYRYGGEGPVGEALAATGLVRFQLPPGLMDPISAASAPLIETVRQRVSRMREAGEVVKFVDQGEAFDSKANEGQWKAVMTALQEIDAFGLTTRFFGARGCKLQSAAVLVSQPRPREEGEEPPATEGMHIDSAGRCVIKGVLYLNEVGPDQGPFRLIPGSHRWEEGSRGRLYRRAFDRSSLLGRGGKKRRLFTSLPPEMQVKAEFGSDLQPDQPETRALLAAESVSLGAPGLLSLFDPEAIHRGGQARAGERHALMITIEARF